MTGEGFAEAAADIDGLVLREMTAQDGACVSAVSAFACVFAFEQTALEIAKMQATEAREEAEKAAQRESVRLIVRVQSRGRAGKR